MRVLIANDKFKGSLTANEAAAAIAAGLPEEWEIDLCPIADGGEGFTETMLAALGGKWVEVETVDAVHRARTARYAVTPSGLAVMEMASACGYEHIAEVDRDLMNSSTYGVGLMLQDAAGRKEVERILIGLGGSATNDGGVGMVAALGGLFLDAEEDVLMATPAGLTDLAMVDLSGMAKLPPVDVACDVENPLLGENGATEVFGPQKGAGEIERPQLEKFLTRLMEITQAEALAETPGAGAAGGLGFGMMHFLNAELHPGFDLVAEAMDLSSRIAEADLVITGEGSLDEQSLSGKGPVGVARLAKDLGKPVLGLAGQIDKEVRGCGLFDQCGALTDFDLPVAMLMEGAADLLTRRVRELRDLLPLV